MLQLQIRQCLLAWMHCCVTQAKFAGMLYHAKPEHRWDIPSSLLVCIDEGSSKLVSHQEHQMPGENVCIRTDLSLGVCLGDAHTDLSITACEPNARKQLPLSKLGACAFLKPECARTWAKSMKQGAVRSQ